MAPATRTVLGTCHHDCPDSCGWVVTVQDGVATKLRGNPAHPYSRGELCPKVNRFLDRVYSEDRILHPLRRTGPKGSGRFERISWDAALDLIGRRLKAAVARHGGEAVLPYWSAGNQSALSHHFAERFLRKLGSTVIEGSVCGMVANAGFAATNGSGRGADPMDVRFSRLVILWGTNTKITNRHLWPFVEEARAKGARVVVIDPIRTATADAADWFVQPFPGTDAALALGMMHVLIRDGLVDHDYVEQHATGFDALSVRVKEWTPERAGEVCGLDPAEIERLATAYGTTRPAMIRGLIGAEHRENGAMLYRTLACLPVLTGSWRERGGGYARSVGTYFGTEVDTAALGAFAAAGTTPRVVNTNHVGRTLADCDLDPPVEVFLCWNGNPLVTQPNSEEMRRGLQRDDLFTVVHEQFLTDTARYADVVLPATSQIEQLDVVPAWGHLYVGWNAKAIDPPGECVSNTELFRRLAGAMGYTERSLFESDESLVATALRRMAPERRRALERDGYVRLDLPDPVLPYADGGFRTASGQAELYSTRLEARDIDPLPDYVAAREGPQGDAEVVARFPLVLHTTKSHTRFLNSSYSHLPKHGPLEGGPSVEIHPTDAEARRVADGALVRVWNDRASLVVPARHSARVRPGMVAMPFGWWMKDEPGGGVANSLTSDELSDWGGGVAYHDTLVEVEAV